MMRGRRSRRSRSALTVITVLVTAGLGLGARTASADPPTSSAGPDLPAVAVNASSPTDWGSDAQAPIAGPVLLPTGQRVRLAGAAGQESILVDDAGPSGSSDGLSEPGRTLISHRLDSHVYVMPAVAQPYLGRFLEPGLFDVTALAASAREDGRLPVRIAYGGAVPTVPGVEITDAADGTATGYLTRASAVAFGRALTDQWLADSRAGWPERTSLFPGVTRIGTGAAVPEPAQPQYPMYTVSVRTIGADGQPQPQSRFGVMNVDDGRKYSGFVTAENGMGQVSVPAGTYSAVGDQFSYDPETGTTTLTITAVNEFTVTGPGQTLTLDQRTATAEPGVSTPKPAEVVAHYLEWNRRDVSGERWMSTGYFLGAGTQVRMSPSPEPSVGSLNITQNWGLDGPGDAPEYTYDLASLRHGLEADPQDVFTDADLATVNASYYGDGTATAGALLRYPRYPNAGGGGGGFHHTPRPSARTEYVGATGGRPTWVDAARLNYGSNQDPGDMEGPERLLPPGSRRSADWFHGPLAAGVPEQTGQGQCYMCRSGNQMLVALSAFIDSDPTHRGSLRAAGDGTPVARYRLYADGELVTDQNDMLGGGFAVPAESVSYRAVLDVDRRLSEPAQSVRTQTELTFGSAAGEGAALPDGWVCEPGDCRILPVLQARVGLATSLTGRLPVGDSPVSVTVARIQGAEPASIASVTLEVRPAGGDWTPVELGAGRGGRFTGVIDGSAHAGADVDLRVSATDEAGSSFRQTIEKAYTVEES